jgi:hypothetical protein
MGRKVIYNGVKMDASWPARIESQLVPEYTERGVKYPRVRFGDEQPGWGVRPCNCGVVKGQFHVVGQCEFEKCPKCGVSFGEYHECDFDELRDAEADRRAASPRATLLRWVGFILFLAAVLALLRAAP